MKASCAVQTRAVAVLAMLAFASSALAERELYQWVDSAGNVIYGDSPPTVTHSRKVDSSVTEELLRTMPDYLFAAPQEPAQVAESPRSPEEEAALLDALNRLQSVMTQMQALTTQVDKLESRNEQLEAKVSQESQNRELVRNATELAVQPPPSETQPASEDPKAAAPRVALAATKPTPVAPEPAHSQPLSADRQPVRKENSPTSTETTPPESVDVEVSETETATEVASFHREQLDGETIIGSQPLLEVAVPEPQPIKSQMSPKERDRSRWQSQNRAQQRFLERLSKRANKTPPAN